MVTRVNAALNAAAVERYVQAAAALKAKTTTDGNGDSISVYDQFVAIHLAVTLWKVRDNRLVPDGGHGDSAFLPWHREYLVRFERALQDAAVEAGVAASADEIAIPYWDWADGTGTQALFTDGLLGPDGRVADEIMESGPFTPDQWPVHSELNGPNLRRQITRHPFFQPRVNCADPFGASCLPDSVEADDLADEPSYESFRPAVEGVPFHNYIHMWIGGSMAAMTSPNDPIFFMHHANVDRLWATWQRNGHEGPGNYAGDQTANGGVRPFGHKLNDDMWPWDGGQAVFLDLATAQILAQQNPQLANQLRLVQSAEDAQRMKPLLPSFAADDVRRPADVLDVSEANLGYVYDDMLIV